MQGKRKGAKPTTVKADKAKPKPARAKKNGSANGSTAEGQERLRPGQLDGLVLGYMKKHRVELPVGPSVIARGINRSSGAVGNCLGRLEKEKKVQLTRKKPREYDLTGSKN
jgi:hypothetical protein